MLFLLFYEGNGLSSRAVGPNVSRLSNPIEVYLKAAEEGYAAAQYIVGLAHLEGDGVEKNGHSAYYWLRMADAKSCRAIHNPSCFSRCLRVPIAMRASYE